MKEQERSEGYETEKYVQAWIDGVACVTYGYIFLSIEYNYKFHYDGRANHECQAVTKIMLYRDQYEFSNGIQIECLWKENRTVKYVGGRCFLFIGITGYKMSLTLILTNRLNILGDLFFDCSSIFMRFIDGVIHFDDNNSARWNMDGDFCPNGYFDGFLSIEKDSNVIFTYLQWNCTTTYDEVRCRKFSWGLMIWSSNCYVFRSGRTWSLQPNGWKLVNTRSLNWSNFHHFSSEFEIHQSK